MNSLRAKLIVFFTLLILLSSTVLVTSFYFQGRTWLFPTAFMCLIMVEGIVPICYLSKFHIKPMGTLIQAARKVTEEGDLLQVTVPSCGDEMGELVRTYNEMVSTISLRKNQCLEHGQQLKRLNSKLAEMNQTLEERVRKRTTEMQDVIRHIRDEKRKSESILLNIEDGVIVVDVNGSIIHINRAAGRMFMNENRDSESRLLSDLSQLAHLYSIFRNLTIKDKGEMEVNDPESNLPRVIMYSSFPYRNDKGLLLGKIAVFHDITHFKEADRLKSEFFSQISHELRTPLTAIRGYIENLCDGIAGDLNSKQLEYLDRMTKNSETLIRRVSDLLDISLIESKKMQIHLAPMPLYDLIGEAVNELRPLAAQKTLNVSLAEFEGNGRIQGDRDKIKQVITKLLDYSFMYAQPGGRITISLAQNHKFFRTSIRNTGIEIPPKERTQIFDRFYRPDPSSVAESIGTINGLFVEKNIIEMHGGQIGIDNEAGKGSEFYFTLPV